MKMKSWSLSKSFLGIIKSQEKWLLCLLSKENSLSVYFFSTWYAESQHMYLFSYSLWCWVFSVRLILHRNIMESIGPSWLSIITRSLLELKLGLKGRCYIMVPEGRLLLARFSGFLERARASYRRGLMCIIGRNVHFFNVNIILRAQLNWQTMGSKSLKSRMVQ